MAIKIPPSTLHDHDHPPTSSPHKKIQNDLYESMKPLIIFGRLTCVIPYVRENHSSWKKALLGLGAVPILINLFFVFYLLVSGYFDWLFMIQKVSKGKGNVTSSYMRAHSVISTTMKGFVYVYFLKNSARLYKIFQRWEQENHHLPLERDKWLRPLSTLLILYPVGQCLFYAYVYYNLSVSFMKGMENISWIQVFHNLMTINWNLPYRQEYAILLFALKIITYLPILYVTPLIIFFSRVLSFQFKRLIETASAAGIDDAPFEDFGRKDKSFWHNIVERHKALNRLVKTVNNFLSPLMFWWISYNVYQLSSTLYRAMFGVKSQRGEMPNTLFIPTFVIGTTQFLVTVVCATKVNTYAVKILNILRNCPKEHYYNAEVYRLERHVTLGPSIGFTGMGCFALTRPFLIKIFNAVFTAEIMLLQSDEPTKAKNVSMIMGNKTV